MITILSIIGFIVSVVAMIYFFIKAFKNDFAPYHSSAMECSLVAASFIMIQAFAKWSIIPVIAIVLSTIALIYTVINGINCLENFVRDFAIECIEKAGLRYKDFKRMTREEQIKWLKTTPCTYDNGETIMVEDEDDLECFKCILNKK